MKNNLIKNICEKAINNHIGLQQFYSEWPEDVNDIQFYKTVYDDIEDYLEHMPYTLFTRKPKYDSEIYLKFYLDYILLDLVDNCDDAKLLLHRNNILKLKYLDKETLDAIRLIIVDLTNHYTKNE